jgi:hypothetical protein
MKTGTLTGSGFTYKYDCRGSLSDAPGAMVTLYNAASRFTNADMTNRDGSRNQKVGSLNFHPWIQVDGARARAEAIINGAFSAAEKLRVKGSDIMIVMIMSPDTGAVIEVYFTFTNDSPYATIPPATYRKIEVGLIRDISFIPTDEGRQMNYLMCGWMHEVV